MEELVPCHAGWRVKRLPSYLNFDHGDEDFVGGSLSRLRVDFVFRAKYLPRYHVLIVSLTSSLLFLLLSLSGRRAFASNNMKCIQYLVSLTLLLASCVSVYGDIGLRGANAVATEDGLVSRRLLTCAPLLASSNRITHQRAS